LSILTYFYSQINYGGKI
jgi:hypothetical protein